MRDTLTLMIALVASVLVAAGAGAWFLLRGPTTPQVSRAAPGTSRSQIPSAASNSTQRHQSSTTSTAPKSETPPTTPAAVPEQPDDPAKYAEPLPELPKGSPYSELTMLLPDKSLYLEKMPDGKKRVLLVAEVCVNKPPEAQFDPLLEVFLCRKNFKDHEAVLRVDMDARFIHAALEAAGTRKGSTVQFVDAKTGDEAYKPATGGVVKVSVHYRKDGKLFTHTAQEWIKDKTTGKPMAHDWVFAGSRFAKNPDNPDAPDWYCANGGEVIAVSNFPDSMLDLPIKVTDNNAELTFEADMKKVPPMLSKVWVILEPTGAKK